MRRDPAAYGEARARWSLAAVQRVCDWLQLRTPAGLSRLLKRLGIHYKRAREHIHSPDPDYVAKLSDIRVCVQRAQVEAAGVVVLFQDEFTYYRQPTLAAAYEAKGHRQALAERSYQRNSCWRVAATLDPWTGRVVYSQRSQFRVSQLVAFYNQVRAAYPTAETIYLVQDNWPMHFHPDVLAALQPQHLKWPLHLSRYWPTAPTGRTKPYNLPIQLLPLPTYASWTNPIEKLWRQLRQEVLHLHRLADDWPALKQRVATSLDRFAQGSRDLLRYVGLQHPEKLYHAVCATWDGFLPLRC